MSVTNWPKAQLMGEVQTIPRVCPNCMKPAEVDLRYAYTASLLFYRGASTRYYQSFGYCRTCAGQAEEAIKHDNRCQFWLTPGGLFLALFIACLPVIVTAGLASNFYVPDPNQHPTQRFVGRHLEYIVGGAITLVVGLTAAFLSWRLRGSLNRAKSLHPQRPEQAVWGLAAYYTGDCAWAALTKINWSNPDASAGPIREYRAVRPEWLRLLVEANPHQADDETYQRIVGVAKPAKEATRPFPK